MRVTSCFGLRFGLICARAPQTLCPGFIYISRTEPSTWPKPICLQTNLGECVRVLHCNPTVHLDICESISCLKRKHPPFHLTPHTHKHRGHAARPARPGEAVCACEPVCTGGGRDCVLLGEGNGVGCQECGSWLVLLYVLVNLASHTRTTGETS